MHCTELDVNSWLENSKKTDYYNYNHYVTINDFLLWSLAIVGTTYSCRNHGRYWLKSLKTSNLINNIQHKRHIVDPTR